MPKETGLSLVFWIYSNAYPIICMILSGHQRFDYAQKALKLHCASYVLKPIDKTQLCDEIRHALELKQILLQKKLDFPAAPTFINNSKK